MPDLCQLADVKAWLTIPSSNTAEDALIQRLLSAVSADFMNIIGRPDLFPAASYTDVRLGNGRDYMFLRHWPINTITSVTVDTTVIAASPDGIQSGYWLDTNLDMEDRTKLSLIGYLFTNPGSQAAGLGFQGSAGNPYPTKTPNVTIVYNAGYVVVPPDVEQAVIDWVSYRYKQRQWIGQASKHMNQGETTSFQNVLMPESTKAVALQYRQNAAMYSHD